MNKKDFFDEKMSVIDLVDTIKRKYPHLTYIDNIDNTNIKVGDTEINVNFVEKKYDVVNLQKPGRKNILDLKSIENYSVLMLLVKLLDKGYSISNIFLEKGFKLGHKPGYLDVYLSNKRIVYMIEVKKNSEIDKYTSCKHPEDTKQALSYAFQDKNTKVVSYYTYNFESDTDDFYNIVIDDTFQDIKNVDDFYDVWNQIFNKDDFIKNNNIFQIPTKEITYAKLSEISVDDTKKIFSKFLNLLRVYSISDKPNAFMKFINLMLCKIGDEVAEDTSYQVCDKNGNIHTITGLKCQYLSNVDTPESFNIRLNELYQKGMDIYLNKKIIGYSDSDIQNMIRLGSGIKIKEAFTTLSLKYSNPFNFIEIYNDETFFENFLILKGMVEIIQNFKFKYDYKQQFLGDFFEEMLNTSLKQDEGQFFTPMPIVDFIINSIPYEEHIIEKLNSKKEFEYSLPFVIDYACGAGHFLTSSMVKTQEAINNIYNKSLPLTNKQKVDLENAANPNRQYFWVNEVNVVGIEKDYRLAKTTKITTYLNGDGRATVINADGIDKFSSKDYAVCNSLYDKDIANTSKNPSHCINKFDYLISNPPYSVQGFTKNLNKNNIEIGDGTFSLYNEKYTEKDTRIENLFVERAYQLLKPNGIAAIVLPQSVLTSDKYTDIRNFMYKYFKVVGLVLTSDITFSGTTTSPVIIFLQKLNVVNINMDLNYKTVVITSPKYKNPKIKKVSEKEKQFLGYQFSTNKNNSGIELFKSPILERLHIYIKEAFLNNSITISKQDEDYVSLFTLSDICIPDDIGNLMIYPKYNKNLTGKPVKNYCNINSREESEFAGKANIKYLEIGDIEGGKVNHSSNKAKKTTRFAKKGDILLSSLCPTADKIAIADDDYMVSTAIHVLQVKSGYDTNDIVERLRKASTLEQMNSLLDGFKITYAKINEHNLSNYILI